MMLESSGPFWTLVAIMFAIALFLSSIGFKKFVYFFSVGYRLTVFGIGLALMIFTAGKFDFVNINNNGFVNYILAVVLILYGMRLAGFLLMLSIISFKIKQKIEGVLFIVALIFIVGMGYLSTRRGYDGVWIQITCNVIYQGVYFAGCLLLKKYGIEQTEIFKK